jgi:hypothetical protein
MRLGMHPGSVETPISREDFPYLVRFTRSGRGR